MAQANSSHLGTFNDSTKYYFDNGADACKNVMRKVFFFIFTKYFCVYLSGKLPFSNNCLKNTAATKYLFTSTRIKIEVLTSFSTLNEVKIRNTLSTVFSQKSSTTLSFKKIFIPCNGLKECYVLWV